MTAKDFFSKFKKTITSTRYWLMLCTIGIWVLVLQNFGVFGSKSQKVYVTGGDVDARVWNTVDVNLDKVLGYPIGCHTSYKIDGKEYQAIDVHKSNW